MNRHRSANNGHGHEASTARCGRRAARAAGIARVGRVTRNMRHASVGHQRASCAIGPSDRRCIGNNGALQSDAERQKQNDHATPHAGEYSLGHPPKVVMAHNPRSGARDAVRHRKSSAPSRTPAPRPRTWRSRQSSAAGSRVAVWTIYPGRDRPRHGWRGRSLHGRIHGVPARDKSSGPPRGRSLFWILEAASSNEPR